MINSTTSLHPWTSCLTSLKEKLSDEVFNQWITPLKVFDLSEFQVSLAVPQNLDMDQLGKMYLGLIEHCYQEVNGREVRIQLRRMPNTATAPGYAHPFTGMPVIDLNPNYTFEEFVVGSNSQFAYSAALAVAKDPGGTKFNPLLIYGGVGLGKTHLLQAIGNLALAENSRKKVRYVTSEAFYREFVESIQHNRINELSNYYRNEVDLLLMDDVQFMSGKDRTQEEFFHIFNSLHQSRKQIVLTSDSPPGELKGLEDRLVSRFQWGLFVDIQPPDRETREAILRRKAMALNLDISDDIIGFLAEAIDSNIRVIEGAIRQLLLQASIKHSDITMELAKEIVNRTGINRPNKKVTPEDITTVVANYFVVEVDKIIEQGRGTKEVAQARQLAMFLMKELTSASLKTIGQRFGGRDHSTVVHAIKTIEKAMEKDDSFKKSVDAIMNKLSTRP
ncbi:MAG: chromosomal replication initiator protein DnaA [Fibrobacterota bacterium]|nr:chromosomal replication initiator protein DnaA [Fibrobacterota bacterium]